MPPQGLTCPGAGWRSKLSMDFPGGPPCHVFLGRARGGRERMAGMYMSSTAMGTYERRGCDLSSLASIQPVVPSHSPPRRSPHTHHPGGPNSASQSSLPPFKKRELGDLYVWGSLAHIDPRGSHTAGLKPQPKVRLGPSAASNAGAGREMANPLRLLSSVLCCSYF